MRAPPSSKAPKTVRLNTKTRKITHNRFIFLEIPFLQISYKNVRTFEFFLSQCDFPNSLNSLG